MDADPKATTVLTVLIVVFLGLALSFGLNLWGDPVQTPPIPPVNPEFIKTSTVRVSLAERIRTGGDISDFDCNSCHEENKSGKIEFDAKGDVILPAGHQDMVMQHGRNHRNENCFNCHDEANHAMLHRSDGRKFKLVESTELCAGCHGPTYRDWEIGIHGRISGYWDRNLGPVTRQDCVSCHNPHAPAFPSIKPAPGPHALHPKNAPEKKEDH
jgi:hypothetical protein